MNKYQSRHVLIAGTGRAGTSLLVKILDACGLETHLNPKFKSAEWHDTANAGLENNILDEDKCPYIIKSPWIYNDIKKILETYDSCIDLVIIPIRNLREATLSRLVVENQIKLNSKKIDQINSMIKIDDGASAGGVIFSLNPLDQARILAMSFHLLIEELVEKDINFVFMKFPKFAQSSEYCFEKINSILPENIDKNMFRGCFEKVVDADLVRVEAENFTFESEVLQDATIDFPSAVEISYAAAIREIKKSRTTNDNLEIKLKEMTERFEVLSRENHVRHIENEKYNIMFQLLKEKFDSMI